MGGQYWSYGFSCKGSIEPTACWSYGNAADWSLITTTTGGHTATVMQSSPRAAATRHAPQAVPADPPGPSRSGLAGAPPPAGARPARLEILERAEALAIPWDRILLEEIQAEQALRRYAADVDALTLETELSILPISFLRSWRVRDEIDALGCAARGAALRSAVTTLRAVFRRLVGQPERGRAAFTGHLDLAYARVLLLQRVCRAASRSRGTTAERMAFVCASTHCGYDDAAWALCREDVPRPGHRLDAAVRKVRDEGFQIPRASNEARAFAELRRIVRASSATSVRRAPRPRSPRAAALPSRVGLPADGILK